MSYEEMTKIQEYIEKIERKMKKEYKGGIMQHAILEELFEWFNNNGHCVFICRVRKTKKLSTQTNISEIYMAKYGIRFEVTSCMKNNRCVDLRIKLL